MTQQEQQQEQVQVNALRTFCHAIPNKDGIIDPHQAYMGVISISVFRGRELDNVNILGNTIIELRMVQPGINYPVCIQRARNGSLKEFQSGKRLFTPFGSTQDLQYQDHYGKGFSEFINQKVIEGLIDQIPNESTNGKKPHHRIMFTVDINGKVHKLNYERYERELTGAAAELVDQDKEQEDASSSSSNQENSADNLKNSSEVEA